MKLKPYLFTLVLILFFGCEKDSVNNSTEDILNETSELDVIKPHDIFQNVSFQNVIKDKNFKKMIQASNLEMNSQEKINIFKTGSQDFDIDTNQVTKIVYDSKNYLSYTFKLNSRENSDGFIENLMIENDNGIHRSFLISYIPDSEWTINYLKGNKIPFKGRISVRVLTDGKNTLKNSSQTKSGCSYVSATTYVQCTCVGHWPGESCSCDNQPRMFITTIPICGVITEVYSDGGYGGGAYGGGDGSGSDEEDPTTGLTGVGGDDSSVNTAQALTSMLNLNSEESDWLSNNNVSEDIDMSDILYSYVKSNTFSSRSLIAVKKALLALKDNPTIPWDLVENWFLNLQDEIDGELLNTNTSLYYSEQLTQQSLPDWTTFFSHFPKVGFNGNYTAQTAHSVYYEVGGTLWTSYQDQPESYENACAIRGSRGLLYSGIQIPIAWTDAAHNNQRTQKGGDLNNYILDAISFNRYMIDKFGDTPDKLTGEDANNPVEVAKFLRRKKGIYVIVNENPQMAGYNGHVDAIINGKCISSAYTTPQGAVKSIRVWKLQ
ncbi:T6SS effector amidase Tae4 family protein [Salegentibacter agarivorans]